jgi:hypothetical protein
VELRAALSAVEHPDEVEHTRVVPTVPTAAKHHWTTRVRPWTSPGISLPAFSAR